MKNKIILVGTNGRMSVLGLMPELTVPDAQIVIRRTQSNKAIGYRVYTGTDATQFKKEGMGRSFDNAVVIRWGNRIQVPIGEGTIEYNKSEAIGKASDKKLSRSLLTKANILVPQAVIPASILDEQYPVVARPRQHSEGKDFVLLKDYGTFLNHYSKNKDEWYYSEFVNKTEEYRVHCGHGKILGMMSKPAPTKPGVIAWNFGINEEQFDAVRFSEFNQAVCLAALNACKALGLDYGGVDVMVKGGVPYVLEVNTSPALNASPYMTTKYAKYFSWLLKKDERREPFKYEEYKKVESYAWKNFNFEDRTAKQGAEESA